MSSVRAPENILDLGLCLTLRPIAIPPFTICSATASRTHGRSKGRLPTYLVDNAGYARAFDPPNIKIGRVKANLTDNIAP